MSTLKSMRWQSVAVMFLLTLTGGNMSHTAIAQTAVAQTRVPSKEPVLRIETGMHTAVINRISVDAANRFLVTASDDKSVRVWELATGRLLRVIRVPIGAGNEGKVFAVAISPDGNTIAAGGWTGYEWDKTLSIYIFDRESGRVIRRLGGLPNVTLHLVYSPDGRYLAATMGEKNGVRVFSTPVYTQTGEDTDYGSDCYGADFDRTGKLVTTSRDGFIRIYATGRDGSLRLLAKRSATGGQLPEGIKFSPDGSRIAVGFYDSSNVAVLQANDLALLYAPDIAGISRNLYTVEWSADGRTLYAGGSAINANNVSVIRTWSDGGRGGYRDIVGQTGNAIMYMLSLRDGGLAFGSGEPSFGVLDSNGTRRVFVTSAVADYRNNDQGLLLAPDGMGVAFAYQVSGQSPARFSLAERKLDTAPAGNMNWRPAETEDSNLHVTEWKHTYTPKLNGTLLKLEQYEMARSLALAPDRSAFLLGADFYLRVFDRSGAVRWRVEVPGVPWAVNISMDSKLVVAAYADGTIHWYRLKDGKELLVFFPHADHKRWVVWTPSGYYDAAPGAEELIGWHVNNGPDAVGDFFPAGQFRDAYYRPDVIARVLQTGDVLRALELANEESGRKQQQASIAQQLPPVVEIISPVDSGEISTTEVTVRFRIRTPSGEPVKNVKVLVDGRPVDSRSVEGARLLVQEAATTEGARELRVTLPERDSTVSIIAENRYASSVPANVRLKWRARTSQATNSTREESFVVKPKLYILAIGVSKYANEKYNLKFADKDARDFVSTMQAQKDLLYRDVVVKTLINEQATKEEILDGLDWIRKQTSHDDVAMVFFAGHGVNDQNNFYFFCPYNIDPEKMLRTGVSFSDIKNAVSSIAGKTLFFVDSCHSGNSLGLAGRRGGLDINIVINELSSANNGAVVFSASTSSESSYEREEWNNGAFTKALVEGLNGRASFGNSGRITYAMLNVYISERVKELTKGTQHPTMISPQTIEDFPVAMKR